MNTADWVFTSFVAVLFLAYSCAVVCSTVSRKNRLLAYFAEKPTRSFGELTAHSGSNRAAMPRTALLRLLHDMETDGTLTRDGAGDKAVYRLRWVQS